MARSKALRPDWLPAVALCTGLATVMLAWNPPVGDLAAQVFRAELFHRAGMAIWNGSWYGGHYTLTYSVLFPPLAAALGPQAVGMLSVVASSFLFDRLVRDRWGEAARPATLWFAAGVVTLLADGQLTFALGVAFGLATLRCLQLGRHKAGLACAAACAFSSPVAAAFLAGVVLVGSLAERRPSRTGLCVAAVVLALTVLPNVAFPEPGQFPFVFSSFVAVPLWCLAALCVTHSVAREERQLRLVVAGYLLAATAIWLVPNPMGGNAVRLGALFGGPVLAAVVLARRPRVPAAALALVMAGSLYWQLTASVNQIARSVGDPSTKASYFQPLIRWLRGHGGGWVRVEVPPTANHWESAYLTPGVELARGWLRQLDTTRDDIFYADDEPLTDRAYRSWLRRNAISFVALPDAPLDYSSVAERRLILRDPPYLRLRWHSSHWRLYEVREPKPLVDPIGLGLARTRWVGRQSFALDVSRPGDFLVRVNFTPYWSIGRGRGCVMRRGDWTLVRATRPGVFRVSADFSLGSAWRAVTGARQSC